MATPISQIFHIYSRLGFSISYANAKLLSAKSLNDIINGLIVTSTTGIYLTEIGKEDILLKKDAMESGMAPKEYQKLIKDKLQQLNISWIKKLLSTENVLLEKQTLFWHNHFACRVRHPYLMQELNNIHRKFAFGSFRDLLVEVSKSPAMLIYLNNQQNKKAHPNENFARELMELFTLGRGNYTEQDVQEVARAFTGWSFNKDDGSFEFKEKQHDDGEKTIFTRKGNFGGEDVINMIISNKQTAYFITKKIYKYYVNETINEERVKQLADFYYQNQYNTGALIKKIFTSKWFYDAENIGCNIKSPIDYLVGLSRQFSITYNKYNVLFNLQRVLGQQLFYPPNVAGWPGGKNYIDSTTLVLRMKLPSLILNNGQVDIPDKIDDPDDQKKEEILENKKMETSVNWTTILEENKGLDLDKLFKVYLLKMPSQKIIEKIKSDQSLGVKEMILKIVSLPEYNLA
ncbi:MAG: DUF1800 domain-containing protein [Bacteroidetes bacterium]|nr:DUF1800 domain-containing protein [Bacteroidota bacterium]